MCPLKQMASVYDVQTQTHMRCSCAFIGVALAVTKFTFRGFPGLYGGGFRGFPEVSGGFQGKRSSMAAHGAWGILHVGEWREGFPLAEQRPIIILEGGDPLGSTGRPDTFCCSRILPAPLSFPPAIYSG